MMIRETTYQIPLNGRQMTVFAACPDGAGPFRAVILYMDLFGLRDELFDLAREFANDGFVALTHDMFYRREKSIFKPANGKDGSVDPDAIAAGDETTVEMALQDTRDLISAVDNGLLEISVAGYGAIGYCMGGRHALAAAARLPERIYTGVSVHGGKLVATNEDSPHLLIRKLRVPFWFAFAEDDPTCPDDHQTLIQAEAASVGPHVSCTALSAHHGWTFPARWSHDAAASRFVRKRAVEMFREGIAEPRGRTA